MPTLGGGVKSWGEEGQVIGLDKRGPSRQVKEGGWGSVGLKKGSEGESWDD